MSSTNAASIRKPYPSDVSDEEWAFVAPYLALVRGDAPQRRHDLREAFNAARWVAHTGAPWRWLPHDLPPSCAWSPGATASPARRSWTVARCSRRPRAARRGAPAIPLNDHHPLGPLALFGQTDFLAAFLGGGKGTAKKGARPIQLALLVEGGQSGTPDALPDSSFAPALESSPHRRGRAIPAG
jgi:transposase